MDKTIIEIPTELLQAAKLTAEEAKTELAIRLYQTHKLNDEQAGTTSGRHRPQGARSTRSSVLRGS